MWGKLSQVRKVALKTAVFYFASALVFAAVYWVGWQYTTDAFVLNEEFNLFPIEELRGMWGGKVADDPGGSYKISELYAKVREVKQRHAELDGKIKELQERLDVRRQSSKDVYARVEKMSSEGEARYREKELTPFVAEKEAINQKIARLEKELESGDSIRAVELVRQIGALNIALPELEIRRLNKQGEIIDGFLKDPFRFADPEILADYRKLDKEQRQLEDELAKVQQQRWSIVGQVYKLWTENWKQRIDRLGFIDFVYFSLGVATTTTFGDMIPNSRGIRLAVILQLTVSLVIVGVFVTAVAESILTPAPGSEGTRV